MKVNLHSSVQSRKLWRDGGKGTGRCLIEFPGKKRDQMKNVSFFPQNEFLEIMQII